MTCSLDRSSVPVDKLIERVLESPASFSSDWFLSALAKGQKIYRNAGGTGEGAGKKR